MARKKVTLAVDPKFFDNLYEKERKRLQEKIGVNNLSQINFSKMITGFTLAEPKDTFSSFKQIKKVRKNGRL